MPNKSQIYGNKNNTFKNKEPDLPSKSMINARIRITLIIIQKKNMMILNWVVFLTILDMKILIIILIIKIMILTKIAHI